MITRLKKLAREHILPLLRVFYPLNEKKLPVLNILTDMETLELVAYKGLSCVRFGDGEFNILFKGSAGATGYQKGSFLLQRKLEETLNSNNKNLIICVPFFFSKRHMLQAEKSYKQDTINFWKSYIVKNCFSLCKCLSNSKHYGCAEISRPYMCRLNNQTSSEVFLFYKAIFSKRKIVIVEGEKTYFGVGNDLLEYASSVQRVVAPAINAFSRYEDILNVCLTFPKDRLFLVALGPTAKPLVFDLVKNNYQAIDVGHLDIEYEWYLIGAKKKVSIKGKYVNESDNSLLNEPISTEKYKSEVVCDLST